MDVHDFQLHTSCAGHCSLLLISPIRNRPVCRSIRSSDGRHIAQADGARAAPQQSVRVGESYTPTPRPIRHVQPVPNERYANHDTPSMTGGLSLRGGVQTRSGPRQPVRGDQEVMIRSPTVWASTSAARTPDCRHPCSRSRADCGSEDDRTLVAARPAGSPTACTCGVPPVHASSSVARAPASSFGTPSPRPCMTANATHARFSPASHPSRYQWAARDSSPVTPRPFWCSHPSIPHAPPSRSSHRASSHGTIAAQASESQARPR